MWLMTKHGFYSIVEKKPGEFHIRARVPKDLENLVERVPLPESEILSTKSADYHYRIIAGKGEVLKVMQFLGETVDYSNFKNRIEELPDQEQRHGLYSEVWGLLLRGLGGYGQHSSKRL